jgi:hypothetical protein
MLDTVLALAVIFRCEILADQYIDLIDNPSSFTEHDGFTRGMALGELKGLTHLMNELTGTSVDYYSFVDAARERANEG